MGDYLKELKKCRVENTEMAKMLDILLKKKKKENAPPAPSSTRAPLTYAPPTYAPPTRAPPTRLAEPDTFAKYHQMKKNQDRDYYHGKQRPSDYQQDYAQMHHTIKRQDILEQQKNAVDRVQAITRMEELDKIRKKTLNDIKINNIRSRLLALGGGGGFKKSKRKRKKKRKAKKKTKRKRKRKGKRKSKRKKR